jgi:hypothetical protein
MKDRLLIFNEYDPCDYALRPEDNVSVTIIFHRRQTMKERIDYKKTAPDGLQGHAGHRNVRPKLGAGALAARTRENAGLANQRLWVLPRHAHQGSASRRRNGAAVVYALSVA